MTSVMHHLSRRQPRGRPCGACWRSRPAPTTRRGRAGRASPAPPRRAAQQDFVVNVGDRVFFETDSTELTPQARATLDKQAQWLQHYNRYAFTIEGHADERGTREYNIALGARAPRRCATISPRAASRPTACARSPTARSGRSRCATTSPAGRRTAARSRCSTRAARATTLNDVTGSTGAPRGRRFRFALRKPPRVRLRTSGSKREH